MRPFDYIWQDTFGLRQTLIESLCVFLGCNSKPEVVFLVDDSGSVGEVNFKKSLDFVYHMIDEMDGIVVGMATFADDVKLNFNLGDFTTKQERLNALYTRYTGGTTNTAAAIRYVQFINPIQYYQF